MEKIYCARCKQVICSHYPTWDDGGDQVYFCTKCKPFTKEEQEFLNYVKSKERGAR